MLTTIAGYSQSDKYTAAMRKNLAMFDSVKTTTDNQALAASFERIGDAEKTQLASLLLCRAALSTTRWMDSKLDKDANAEKIKSLADKADGLTTDKARPRQ